MRTCRARFVHLLGGSRRPSLSSTRRDQYILPWLFSIRCLGPASSREPVFPSYRGTATSFHCRWHLFRGDSLPRLPHVDGAHSAASECHRRPAGEEKQPVSPSP